MSKKALAPIVEKLSPLTSLIASARRLTSATMGNRTGRHKVRGTSDPQQQGWQQDAWEMYDLVGEERFLASTLAGRLAQAKLFVGKVSDVDPSNDPTPVEDAAINNVLQAIGESQAGRTQIMRRLAINLFIAGEGWVVGIPSEILHPEAETTTAVNRWPTQAAEEISDGSVALADLEWQMLSVSEVSSSGDLVKLKVGENGEDLELNPDGIYLIRVWRPHPRRWWEADSPTRASLPVLKELVGLTMHVSAQVDSRLAGAGILIVPASAQQSLRQAAGISDDVADDMFTEALIEAMVTPVSDRGVASAVVPLVVTAPDDVVDKFKYITFSTPLDAEARELRDEAIRRLALGQDAPPELLLGTSGMNHWGAWLTQEETVTTHIEPPLALICDALTTQYLWPVLEQMGVEDFQSYVIWYDVADLIARPQLGDDALKLHERDVISDEALLRAMGFDSEDAPEKQDDKDKIAEIVLRMVEANPALISRPGLKVIIEQLSAVMAGQVPPVYDPNAARTPEGEPDPQPVDGAKGEAGGVDSSGIEGQPTPSSAIAPGSPAPAVSPVTLPTPGSLEIPAA